MQAIQISQPRKTHDAITGLWRVTWDVDGHPVYLESEYELEPACEGIVAAFFLHALKHKRHMDLPCPVDEVFADNLKKVAVIAHDYWRFSPDAPAMPTCPKTAPAVDKEAMFFTCGVDSFYTLRTNLDTVSALINVHGYDIRLDDPKRQAKALRLLTHTAKTLGLDFISVSIDLRDHPLFGQLPWGTTHVAALALAAHCLRKHISRVRIASSDGGKPWGSDIELDKLWSASSLELINNEKVTGALYEKIAGIADWPIAQETLKVCWQNKTEELNCGTCEKCLRTQMLIVGTGACIEKFTSFPDIDLVDAMAKLPHLAQRHMGQWQDAYDNMANSTYKQAIGNLLERSRQQHKRQRRLQIMRNFRHKIATSFFNSKSAG